tara:strand:+ start:122 stop:703 length:582 start_codon:yes stop_codon:yes gene_type:complete
MTGVMQSMLGASFGSGSEPLSLTFYESRYGSNMGSVNVYVVDTSGNIQGSSVYSASGNTFTPLWSLKTAATPDVSGDFRIAWRYNSGTSYRGDYAIDTVSLQGNSYNFDASNDSFVCSTTNTTSSTTAFSGSASVATATTEGRWNRHSGITPSNSTGPNSAQSGSFYLYSETSGNGAGFTNVNFWLFSPVITV